MKFCASIVAASCLSLASGFSIQPANTAFGRTSELYASRAASKRVTRTAWLEKRGLSDGVAPVAAPGAGLMTNDGGLEYIKLVHPDSGASSEIYLFGGVVTSFKDGEGVEFIAVRPDAKMDGSKPISGGLSHCWPQVRQP
jgi:glucose-6-phosphate 1-epimerase